MDMAPAGILPTIRAAASQIGVQLWDLVVFLGKNPNVLSALIADITAKDIAKAFTDLVAGAATKPTGNGLRHRQRPKSSQG